MSAVCVHEWRLWAIILLRPLSPLRPKAALLRSTAEQQMTTRTLTRSPMRTMQRARQVRTHWASYSRPARRRVHPLGPACSAPNLRLSHHQTQPPASPERSSRRSRYLLEVSRLALEPGAQWPHLNLWAKMSPGASMISANTRLCLQNRPEACTSRHTIPPCPLHILASSRLCPFCHAGFILPTPCCGSGYGSPGVTIPGLSVWPVPRLIH